MCSKFGGKCEAMYYNMAPCSYMPSDKGCDDTGQNDAVCRCSLGCDGGAPCTGGQLCTDTGCQPP